MPISTRRRASPSTGSRSTAISRASSVKPMCWRGRKTPASRVWRWPAWSRRTGGKVRLIHWKEYDPSGYNPEQDNRKTVWEGAHHLIERLAHHGEMGAAALYNRLPGEIAESVRDLAYRLYHICDRQGRAEAALDYNVLVSSWSEITRLAASERGRGTQAELALDTD